MRQAGDPASGRCRHQTLSNSRTDTAGNHGPIRGGTASRNPNGGVNVGAARIMASVGTTGFAFWSAKTSVLSHPFPGGITPGLRVVSRVPSTTPEPCCHPSCRSLCG